MLSSKRGVDPTPRNPVMVRVRSVFASPRGTATRSKSILKIIGYVTAQHLPASIMNRKPGPVSRQRAKRACRTCNARRVKCNVTEQQPCRNCALAAVPCELIESRRGKHPRQKKRPAATSTVPSLDLSLGSITSIEASTNPYHIGSRRYSLLDNAQPVPSPNLYDGRPSSPGTVHLQSNSPPDSLHDSPC